MTKTVHISDDFHATIREHNRGDESYGETLERLATGEGDPRVFSDAEETQIREIIRDEVEALRH